jgi:hypothetical protein
MIIEDATGAIITRSEAAESLGITNQTFAIRLSLVVSEY